MILEVCPVMMGTPSWWALRIPKGYSPGYSQGFDVHGLVGSKCLIKS